MKFSALLSIYKGTTSADLSKCLTSLLLQTLWPDEVLVIKDGPISKNTENCLKDYTQQLPLRTLEYPTNRGLGPVLQDALPHCRNDIVARVDTDDVCVPDRFLKQITFLLENRDISVVGGALLERYLNCHRNHSVVRNSPTSHRQLTRYAKQRNPLNHPTVMFRKNDVLSCGGYEKCDLFEDYYLWVKMIMHGFRLANLPDILVETDVITDYFRRRGGLKYVRYEIQLAEKLRQLEFFTRVDKYRFIASRLPLRLSPWPLRRRIYQFMLRQRHDAAP